MPIGRALDIVAPHHAISRKTRFVGPCPGCGGTDRFSININKPNTDPVEARQMVKRVRKKVPALKIITHCGVGYELAPESASAVRQAMRSGSS